MLSNFIQGAWALALNIKSTLIVILLHPVIIGFGIGFCAATGIYIFVFADHVRHVPHVLTQSPTLAFQRVSPQNTDGSYAASYSSFLLTYHRIRALFYASALVFLIIILVALLRF